MKDKRETFGWSIHVMKGLGPTLYTHKINTKDGSLPKWSSQRKLIPNMMEVVKGEDVKPIVKMKTYDEGFQQFLRQPTCQYYGHGQLTVLMQFRT
ncbi:hypothetical protein HKD37_01G001074 [Glycine soja]